MTLLNIPNFIRSLEKRAIDMHLPFALVYINKFDLWDQADKFLEERIKDWKSSDFSEVWNKISLLLQEFVEKDLRKRFGEKYKELEDFFINNPFYLIKAINIGKGIHDIEISIGLSKIPKYNLTDWFNANLFRKIIKRFINFVNKFYIKKEKESYKFPISKNLPYSLEYIYRFELWNRAKKFLEERIKDWKSSDFSEVWNKISLLLQEFVEKDLRKRFGEKYYDAYDYLEVFSGRPPFSYLYQVISDFIEEIEKDNIIPNNYKKIVENTVTPLEEYYESITFKIINTINKKTKNSFIDYICYLLELSSKLGIKKGKLIKKHVRKCPLCGSKDIYIKNEDGKSFLVCKNCGYMKEHPSLIKKLYF